MDRKRDNSTCYIFQSCSNVNTTICRRVVLHKNYVIIMIYEHVTNYSSYKYNALTFTLIQSICKHLHRKGLLNPLRHIIAL